MNPTLRFPSDYQKLAALDRNSVKGLDTLGETYARQNTEGDFYTNSGEAPFGRDPVEAADRIFRFLTSPPPEKPSRDAIYRALADRAMSEHEEAQAGRGDEPEGATVGAPTEVEPGVLFGPPAGTASAPRGAGQPQAGVPVSQYDIMRTAEALLGPKSYTLSRVPGPRGTQASYDRVADAIRTSKMAAGDAGVDIHERAHDISDRYGIESDPTRLPRDVAAGLKQFDYDPSRPMGASPCSKGSPSGCGCAPATPCPR